MSPGARLAPLLALALTVAVGLSTPWRAALADVGARVHSDFQILFAAGQGLAEGQDVHDPAVLDAVGRRTGRQATPFCAANPLVVRLFGLFDGARFLAAFQRWLVIGAALAGLAVLCLAAALRRLGVGSGAALAVALVLVAVPDGFWQSLAMNSTNLVALAALAGAFAAAVRGRPLLEGALLALAAVAKTSPALVLVAVLVAGRRRTALAGALTLIAAGLASIAWSGWAVHASWLTRVLPRLGFAPTVEAGRFDNSLHAWNLAPHGWLARAAHDGGWSRALVAAGAWTVAALVLWQLLLVLRGLAVATAGGTTTAGGAPTAAGAATAAGTTLAGGATTAGGAPTATHGAASGASASAGGSPAVTRGAAPAPAGTRAAWRAGAVHATAVSASLLISSVTWPHHLVLMAIPGAWLAARWLTQGASAARVAGVLAVALTVLPLGALSDDPLQTADIAARSLACLLLFGACTAEAAGLAGRATDGNTGAGCDARADPADSVAHTVPADGNTRAERDERDARAGRDARADSADGSRPPDPTPGARAADR